MRMVREAQHVLGHEPCCAAPIRPLAETNSVGAARLKPTTSAAWNRFQPLSVTWDTKECPGQHEIGVTVMNRSIVHVTVPSLTDRARNRARS